MLNLPSALQSFLVGFGTGFLVCVPIGPVNITIINEGARRGFRWAFMIALGAVAMDAIYCAIAFAAFSALLDTELIKAAMEFLTFVSLSYLGIKFLRPPPIPEHLRTADKIEAKLHP